MKINKRLNSMFLFLLAGLLAATGFTSQAASLSAESPEVADVAYYMQASEMKTEMTDVKSEEKKTEEENAGDIDEQSGGISDACGKLAAVVLVSADQNRQSLEAEAARREQEAREQAEREAQAAREQAEKEAQEAAALELQKLLASIIFCEAGNQPYEGQVAVGAVVMNRVNSGVYPNTVEEVIYQPGQFGPASTGWLNSVRNSGSYTQTSMQAAADVMAGANPVGGCLYFDKGGYGTKIGDHYFH